MCVPDVVCVCVSAVCEVVCLWVHFVFMCSYQMCVCWGVYVVCMCSYQMCVCTRVMNKTNGQSKHISLLTSK